MHVRVFNYKRSSQGEVVHNLIKNEPFLICASPLASEHSCTIKD